MGVLSTRVSREVRAFSDLEKYKKDTFDSYFINVSDDEGAYALLMSSRRWWLEYKSWTDSQEFYFYSNWKVPAENLRFANELFVEQEDLKEVQVVWDTSIHRYYLKRSGCREVTDDHQIPIVRLFRDYPEKEPNGIWGVCERPINLDNPYDYYRASLYSKLGRLDELSQYAVFA